MPIVIFSQPHFEHSFFLLATGHYSSARFIQTQAPTMRKSPITQIWYFEIKPLYAPLRPI